MVTTRSRLQTKLTQLSSKKIVKKSVTAAIRRSGRLRNATTAAQIQETEAVVEQINLFESEKEDEPHVEETPPESTLTEENLEEETDQSVGGLKLPKRHLQNDNFTADLNYRRLYFDSQKQIEALMKENHEISKDLAVTLGKIEGHVESRYVCLALVAKLLDVLSIFNLGKASEAAMNLSSQAVLCRCASLNAAADPVVGGKRRGKGPTKKN